MPHTDPRSHLRPGRGLNRPAPLAHPPELVPVDRRAQTPQRVPRGAPVCRQVRIALPLQLCEELPNHALPSVSRCARPLLNSTAPFASRTGPIVLSVSPCALYRRGCSRPSLSLLKHRHLADLARGRHGHIHEDHNCLEGERERKRERSRSFCSLLDSGLRTPPNEFAKIRNRRARARSFPPFFRANRRLLSIKRMRYIFMNT